MSLIHILFCLLTALVLTFIATQLDKIPSLIFTCFFSLLPLFQFLSLNFLHTAHIFFMWLHKLKFSMILHSIEYQQPTFISILFYPRFFPWKFSKTSHAPVIKDVSLINPNAEVGNHSAHFYSHHPVNLLPHIHQPKFYPVFSCENNYSYQRCVPPQELSWLRIGTAIRWMLSQIDVKSLSKYWFYY